MRGLARTGVAIETALGQLQDERGAYPELHAQLAAVRYYLRWSIRGVEAFWHRRLNHFTNYVTLVDRLARHFHQTRQSIVLVTFNYDTLIERAMADVLRAAFATVDDYTRRDDVRLFKPHGSVNWARRTAISSSDWMRLAKRPGDDAWLENEVIELSRAAKVLDEYVITYRDDVLDHQANGTVVLTPALAIPTIAKQVYEAPDAHIQHLQQELADVDIVITIGWRGAEEHFLRLLESHLRVDASLAAVAESSDAAMTTVEALARTQKFGRFSALGGGFSSFVDPHIQQLLPGLDAVLGNTVDWRPIQHTA